MKRIAITVLAFLIMLSIGVANALYFDKTCRETASAVNEAIRQAKSGNFSAAAKTAQNAENFWSRKRRLFNYTVNHGLLYEVDSRITGLSALSSEEAKEEFLATAEQTAEALNYVINDK